MVASRFELLMQNCFLRIVRIGRHFGFPSGFSKRQSLDSFLLGNKGLLGSPLLYPVTWIY